MIQSSTAPPSSSLVGVVEEESGSQRILLQAPSGWGKTTAALTFPNPLVLNIDNKLPRDRKIRQLPMSDPRYWKELYRAHNVQAEPNLRDVFRLWWEKEFPKVDPSTTIINDSATMISNALITQGMKERKISLKTGEYDTRQMHGEILNYMYYIHELFKRHQGILITICHEYIDRDEKGNITANASPLFSGGFKDQFASHYTNYWRMNVQPVKDAAGKETGEYKYFWQLKPSMVFTPICSFAPPAPFVVADYASIKDLIGKQTVV